MKKLSRVLLATASALVLASTVAHADGGAGGANGASGNPGGAGGATSVGAGGTGGTGGGTNIGGGGGGGAGTTGGNGGGTNGGAGGATLGASGFDATAAAAGDSGAGGGGGAHGLFDTVGITNSTPLGGGSGGAGASGEGGGGGGAGGYGLIVDAGMPVEIINTSSITGGAGGAGGANTGTGAGGNGGDGGIGIFVRNGNVTINNSGSISGGAGGAGGGAGGGTAGTAGVNGVGIVGGDITVINSGSITGANGADAIDFTSGNNTLTLQGSSSINGNISVIGNLDFNQTTAQTLSNVITGTGNVSDSGTGTLTLTGSSTYTGTTTISGGTLALSGLSGGISGSSAVNLSTASAILDTTGSTAIFGPTIHNLSGVAGSQVKLGTKGLTVNETTATTFAGDISGSGEFDKQGSATMTLTGVNDLTGEVFIDNGTLALSGAGSISASDELYVASGATFDISGTNAGASIVELTGEGNVVLGAQTLTLTNAGNIAFGGVISGTGGLTLAGGTEVLEGVNTYTGATTVNTGATLKLSGLGTIIGSSVADNGTFDISGASSGETIVSLSGDGVLTLGSNTLEIANGADVFAGDISGTGGVQIDAGNETFSATNDYTGGTTIAGGTLTLGTAASAGTGTVAVLDGGTLAFGDTLTFANAVTLAGNASINAADGTAATISSVIADGTSTGTLVKTGTGELVLTGANTYTGGTTIGAGTLTAGNDGAFGAGAVTIAGGVLGYADGVNVANGVILASDDSQFDVEAGTATQSGAISETGGARSMEKIGAGIMVIGTPETYTGATIITAGTLRAGANNVFANTSTFEVATGATLDLGGFDETLGELSGSGDVDIGSGTLTVGANNSSTTFSGVLSGSGDLVKTGTGTLTLTGVNTYTGGTTIDGGVLSVQNDKTLGTGAVTLADPVLDYGNGITLSNPIVLAANDAQLQVTAGTATQAGVISQTGGARPLEKIGAGKLVLSATNTYTGPTTVSAGTLFVSGSIASSSLTTVKSGATLSGGGTVGNVQIAAGGIFAPGSGAAGSATTVTGNLTFASTGNYTVALNPSSATHANVSGAATLGGATVNANYASGAYVAKKYTILTAAGGVNGTFGTAVNTNLPSNFTSTLSYDANDVFLNLQLAFVAPNGITRNQKSVGDTLVNYFNTTGSIPLAFGGLTPAGLSEASGEIATASAQSARDGQNQFVQAALAPHAGSADHGWSLWGSIYGGGRSTDGSSTVGSHDLSDHAWGGAVGLDFYISDDFVAGAAYGGGHTSFHLSDDLGSGSGDINQGIVYLRANLWDAAYLTGAYAFGSQDTSTHRATDLDGPAVYRAGFSADVDTWRAEGGWRFESDDFGLIPYAAIQSTKYSSPGYAEKTASGTNTFALTYAGDDLTASRTELGLRADHVFDTDSGAFVMRGRAAWVDNFELDHALRAGFQTLPGTAFTVDGAVEGRNGALLGVSADWQVADGLSFSAGLDGGFSNHSTSYTGQGTLRYTW